MSYPANRLAQYRDYSYYHVLCLCDSSSTADAIASADFKDSQSTVGGVNNIVDRYLHPVDDRYGAKTIQLKDADGNVTGQGSYVVMINGSTDADFVISTFRWTAMTQASVAMDDRFNGIAVEGSMEISEPRGVIFLKRLADACGTVGVSADSVVFLIKTFVIGHRYDPDNSTEVIDYVSDILPLKFLMIDIVSEFTFMGGTYTLELMSIYNGASRLPQYGGLKGAAVNISGSLQQSFQQLEQYVAKAYLDYKKCVFPAYNSYVSALQQQAIDSLYAPGSYDDSIASLAVPAYPPAEDTFADVQYKFELDSLYLSLDANGQPLYKIDDKSQQYSNKAACDKKDATLQIAIGESLEQIIDRIMESSQQVKRDAQGKNPEKQKRGYKIHTKIESIPAGTSTNKTQKLTYVVTYKVSPFLFVKNTAIENILKAREGSQSNVGTSPDLKAQIQRNVIEFDYIYSGQNIDIIDFNMKQQMSYAFLTSFTSPDSLKVQGRKTPTDAQGVKIEGIGSDVAKYRTLVQPLYFGALIQSPRVVNSSTPYDASAFHVAFTKWASLEALEAKIRITGNTQLLNSTARDTTRAPDLTKLPPDATLYDWGTFPALAKINVYMPVSTDDIAAFQHRESYTTKFWYDSYYYIISIDHIFQDGAFEQELEMISLPYKVVDDNDPSMKITDDFAKAFRNCDQVPPRTLNCGDTAQNATTRKPLGQIVPPTNAPTFSVADNRLPMTDSEKKDAAKATPPLLRIKSGSGAMNGGASHAAVYALAQQIQNNVDQFVYFTAFNDAYHQGLSANSMHKLGLALDFAVSGPQYAFTAVDTVESILAAGGLGSTPPDAYIGNEYDAPSINATGGHIHVDFRSQANADKFLEKLKSQGVATPASSVDPTTVTQPPANVSQSATQTAQTPTGSQVLGEQKANCGDDKDKKAQKDAVCEPDLTPGYQNARDAAVLFSGGTGA